MSNTQAINIIFDGPPGPESGRFIEVENDAGIGMRIGEWIQLEGGLWALRITQMPSTGRCSVPMWQNGLPAGHCDQPAYGKRPPCKEWRDAYTGELRRVDGKYNGHVPGLACPMHGGPEPRIPGHPNLEPRL